MTFRFAIIYVCRSERRRRSGPVYTTSQQPENVISVKNVQLNINKRKIFRSITALDSW